MFDRLAQSKFRSGFYLKEKDKAYAADKGREKIEKHCLLYTSPSPRDLSTSRMPSSA